MTYDKLAGMPSKGKEGIERLKWVYRFCRDKMAVDGSRWQFLGRATSRFAPRGAIDNEFFRMADLAKFALYSLLFAQRFVPSWYADSQRA